MILAERFWAKVDRSGGPEACWPWTGARDIRGYGRFSVRGRNDHAHRVALELELGRVLEAAEYACHTCDNKPCVNPRHLYVGTAATNARDAAERSPGFGWAGHPHRGEQHPASRLTDALVIAIRSRYQAGGIRLIDLAAAHGVSLTTISRVVRRDTWTHV